MKKLLFWNNEEKIKTLEVNIIKFYNAKEFHFVEANLSRINTTFRDNKRRMIILEVNITKVNLNTSNKSLTLIYYTRYRLLYLDIISYFGLYKYNDALDSNIKYIDTLDLEYELTR